MNPLERFAQRFRRYNRLSNIGEIARRYFAMNAFDGVLTIIGVLMGNFTAGVEEPRIVVTTGMTTCIAMGISGLWGAYLTEAAADSPNGRIASPEDVAALVRFLASNAAGHITGAVIPVDGGLSAQ